MAAVLFFCQSLHSLLPKPNAAVINQHRDHSPQWDKHHSSAQAACPCFGAAHLPCWNSMCTCANVHSLAKKRLHGGFVQLRSGSADSLLEAMQVQGSCADSCNTFCAYQQLPAACIHTQRHKCIDNRQMLLTNTSALAAKERAPLSLRTANMLAVMQASQSKINFNTSICNVVGLQPVFISKKWGALPVQISWSTKTCCHYSWCCCCCCWDLRPDLAIQHHPI